MSETQVRDYARGRGFHPKTLERWLSWDPADRDALVQIAQSLKIGENHLRDMMDWLEEIAMRDQSTVHAILAHKAIADIDTDPRLGRADKLKRIKEQVRKLRFPRLAEIEETIRNKIRTLNLGPKFRLSVPPGLEEGRLEVEFSAASHDELRQLIAKLARATEHSAMPEIFALLAGRVVTEDRS